MNISELLEKISIDGEHVKFDYNATGGQSSKIGKGKLQPFVSRSKEIKNNTIYSVHLKSDDEFVNIVKAIKKKNDIQIDPKDYQYFLNRTSLFLARILKAEQTDVVVTVKSSHKFIDDLSEYIKNRLPYLKFYHSAFAKQADISKISVADDPRVSDNIRKSLETVIKQSIERGSFEIKRIPPQYRKFIKNLIAPSDANLLHKLEGKSVCVLDDVFSSGLTIVNMIDQIKMHNPSNVFGLTVFKAK